MGGVLAIGSALAGAFGPPLVQAAGVFAGQQAAKFALGDDKKEPQESLLQELARTSLLQPGNFDIAEPIKPPEELLNGTSLLRSPDTLATDFSPEFGLELPAAELSEIREISQRQNKFVSQISEAASLGRITNVKKQTLLGRPF